MPDQVLPGKGTGSGQLQNSPRSLPPTPLPFWTLLDLMILAGVYWTKPILHTLLQDWGLRFRITINGHDGKVIRA